MLVAPSRRAATSSLCTLSTRALSSVASRRIGSSAARRAMASDITTASSSSRLPLSRLSSFHTSSTLRYAAPSTTETTLTRTPSDPSEALPEGVLPSITLTSSACERLDSVASKEKLDNVALRVEVKPGGCHGYQYSMNVEEEWQGEEDDYRFTSQSHPRTHLLIDSTSLRLLRGATIDYATELIGSQFVVRDNPQSKGAGCGCGVSWEPVEGVL